jgi:hypothetical protein
MSYLPIEQKIIGVLSQYILRLRYDFLKEKKNFMGNPIYLWLAKKATTHHAVVI